MREMTKTVFPGGHLSSAMEFDPGNNTYIKDDEIYAAVVGERVETGKIVAVKGVRTIASPHVGMELYCLVQRTSNTKAFVECIPVSEAEKNSVSLLLQAVLPVTAIRRGHVNDLRDEVQIGDIIKSKIFKIKEGMIDVTIVEKGLGVLVAFCPKCRARMKPMHELPKTTISDHPSHGLKTNPFVCSKCKWKDNRKLPSDSGTFNGRFR
jgi:exosome complex RNA-binding protein Csl4